MSDKKTIALAPKSASEKKRLSQEAQARAAQEAAEKKVRGFLTAKKEQYAMNILNGLLANPRVMKLNCIDQRVKNLIDKAYDLAGYQLQKMYDFEKEEK